MRILALVVAAMLAAGCSPKWEDREFPDAGFSVTLPMPFTFEVGDKGSRIYRSEAGKARMRIVHIRIPEDVRASRSPDEILVDVYAAAGESTAKPRGVVVPGRSPRPALESEYAGTMSDGSTWNARRLVALADADAYDISVIWPSGDKDSPRHADRFVGSFRLLR